MPKAATPLKSILKGTAKQSRLRATVTVPTRSKTKAPKVLAPPEESDSNEKDEIVQEEYTRSDTEEEENTHLHGFSDDDESDSSDEDDGVAEHEPIQAGKLPTIARDDENVKKRLEQAKKRPTTDRGVIYLGRIPHGFYEGQMREYFSQFGDVTRLRLSRNKKTGRSKHYAFIEFSSSSVAQIVSETMDNYLLMGHILTCKVIPKDEVHPQLWIGADRKYRGVPHDRLARIAHNKDRTREQQKQVEDRLLRRQRQKKDRLSKLGIKYDMTPIAYKRGDTAV